MTKEWLQGPQRQASISFLFYQAMHMGSMWLASCLHVLQAPFLMNSMKETFRKRVGNYYLGRTLGEVGHTPLSTPEPFLPA